MYNHKQGGFYDKIKNTGVSTHSNPKPNPMRIRTNNNNSIRNFSTGEMYTMESRKSEMERTHL